MQPQLLALVATWLLACGLCATDEETDAVYPAVLLERVAFGSCNKQNKTDLQSVAWASVAAFNPQLWLWTGDAVYSETRSVASLEAAFSQQLAVPSYRQFQATGAQIDGVWDDHDLGINDGGAEVPDLPARQAAYLDFLGEPTDSARRRRTGLYRALTFGVGPQAVKVLMLDTRSFRAPHAIPSVGAAARGVPLVGKLTPLAAAFSRWAAGALGWTAKHRGDVLGAAQWAWLEAQLKRGSEQETTNSAPAFTVVVSSVQVLTTAPVFESWGHFPVAKARLLALLRRYKPRGLLLLSGDVHFAELATYPVKADPVRDASVAGEDEGVGSGVVGCGSVAEVTSSGLTHTCLSPASNFLTRLTCTPVLTHYTSHRPHPGDFYAAAPNFGTLTIDWAASGGPLLTAAVRPTDRRDLGCQPALVLSRRSCLLDLPPIEPPHGNAYPQADESGAALRACTAPSESQGESRD